MVEVGREACDLMHPKHMVGVRYIDQVFAYFLIDSTGPRLGPQGLGKDLCLITPPRPAKHGIRVMGVYHPDRERSSPLLAQ